MQVRTYEMRICDANGCPSSLPCRPLNKLLSSAGFKYIELLLNTLGHIFYQIGSHFNLAKTAYTLIFKDHFIAPSK
jgi:hypothetical protein